MFRDVAAKMVPNGWHNIIPLTIETGQKKPAVKWAQYQQEDIPLDTLRTWYCGRLGQMPLTGMVFGPNRRLVALDIDVMDPLLINRIDNALESDGTPFIRVGNAPKCMAFFKGEVQSQKLNGVEVFGSSGQVAIYGTHPTTKKEYQWPQRSLLDVTPDDLPEITQDQVSAWIERIRPWLAQRDTAGRQVGWAGIDELREALRKDGIDAAQRAVVGLHDGSRHPTLLTVTAWLVSKGYAPADIVTFIDNNFPDHLRKDDWRKLRPRIRQMAEDAVGKFFGEEKW
jgi:hypothetical protein